MKKYRILVTGGSGKLGRDLVKVLGTIHTVFAPTRTEMDITNPTEVVKQFESVTPDIVVHSAAIADVDYAEANQAEATSINVQGTENLVTAAKRSGARFIFISTDYVFDGGKQEAYRETDETNPINYYGSTKLQAEQIVDAELTNHVIARTALLYSDYGKDFVRSVRDASVANREMLVVNDQFGSPTYTRDVARQLLGLLDSDLRGIVHVVAGGEVSRAEYAREIARQFELSVSLNECSSDDFPARVPRPKHSVLSCGKLIEAGLYVMPSWREGLVRFAASQRGVHV